MTLKELINSEPANATRTDQEIFDWLNSPSDEFHPLLVNARQLMAEFGAVNAAKFLDKLETFAGAADTDNKKVIKWALKFITTDGIDVGNIQTRAMLDALAVAGIIEPEERDGVKGLATSKTIAEKAGFSNVKIGHIQEVIRNG